MQTEHKIAVITVTYKPDIHLLKKQMGALPIQVTWIIVDNDSSQEALKDIQNLVDQRKENTVLLPCRQNFGLAKALNIGIKHALSLPADIQYLLLLDQDSVPEKNALDHLQQAYEQLKKAGIAVGCIGPKLIDTKTGLQHGFHYMQTGLWRRVYPLADDIRPVACDNINGSGTFFSREICLQFNGLDESLFIDHVDTEWSFRIKHAGYKLFGIPQAIFDHQMGERSFKFWLLGWKVWPYRSPLRHYYLFRNTVRLLGRGYIPLTWKFWAFIKLWLVLFIHMVFDSLRFKQLQSMWRGVYHAFKNKQDAENL